MTDPALAQGVLAPHQGSVVGGVTTNPGRLWSSSPWSLPLVILLLGIAFNGWNGMQESIRLTSAARAGAIVAAKRSVGDPNGSNTRTVLDDATTAVNEEEFGPGAPVSTKTMTRAPTTTSACRRRQPITPTDVTINVVTITISQSSASFVPFVGSFPVTTHATARYS